MSKKNVISYPYHTPPYHQQTFSTFANHQPTNRQPFTFPPGRYPPASQRQAEQPARKSAAVHLVQLGQESRPAAAGCNVGNSIHEQGNCLLTFSLNGIQY